MAVLLKQIQNYIFEHELIKPGAKIIVGVSGGPDSVFLLDILVKLSKKYTTAENKGLDLHVAHVNYALRGDDSKKDAEFTAHLAGNHGLNFSLLDCKNGKNALSTELEEYKKSGKGNLENIARKIRYNFFEKLLKKHNFDLIAVGHNLDDQAETVLMRLIRGTGLGGLSAISPKNEKIIRPLLATNRKNIELYLKENELSYRIDKTNFESDFTRNKLRNELIPYLEKEYNSNIKEVLVNLASQSANDYNLVEDVVSQKFEKIIKVKNKKALEARVNDLCILDKALINHLFRKMCLFLKDDLMDLESGNIREMYKIVKSKKNKTHILCFKGLEFKRKGDKITLTKC